MFEWIDHPSFRRDEQLLAVLYEMGMATRKQLAIISGWTEDQVEWSIKRIRKWGKTKEDKDQWIRSYRLPLRQNRIAVYTLGKQGLQYVAAMQEQKLRRREAPRGQIAHFLGVNDILCRLLEAGADRNEIRWLSTMKSIDFLTMLYESQGLEYDGSIRPDARLYIGNQAYWIEFDNATEGPRQLEKKLHQYVTTLYHPEKGCLDRAPVIWITINQQRRDYLQKLWNATSRRFDEVPEMKFFIQGDEVDFLLTQGSILAL